jgi:hypothetical protein
VLWSFRKIKPNRAKRNISNEVVYEKKKYTREELNHLEVKGEVG